MTSENKYVFYIALMQQGDINLTFLDIYAKTLKHLQLYFIYYCHVCQKQIMSPK